MVQEKGSGGTVAAEEAKQVHDLELVQQQANQTVMALQSTAAALDEVEAAAAAVERAKGGDDEKACLPLPAPPPSPSRSLSSMSCALHNLLRMGRRGGRV